MRGVRRALVPAAAALASLAAFVPVSAFASTDTISVAGPGNQASLTGQGPRLGGLDMLRHMAKY
jgi:hypothetical protein